jgi:cyclophilin family peptidyl-prolyl cis-trans isomerase
MRRFSELLMAGVFLLACCAPLLAQPLQALPGKDAPAITEVVKVLMQTDLGDLEIEVYPQAAPNAAQRFLELVEMGFFDNTPIFRVVKKPSPFVAQFGINSDFAEWENKSFDDDPTLFQLTRGTLAFAKAGADTNSTQIFINYIENNRLATPDLNFTVFAQVVKGMEIADQFVMVGDERMGLDQDTLWKNHRIVDSMDPKPTMITVARVVDSAGDEADEAPDAP